MSIDPRDRERRNYALRRSIMDCGMGVMIVAAGLFFLFAERFGFVYTVGPLFRYAFAGLCVLYGGFRIYRGIKKNYFSE